MAGGLPGGSDIESAPVAALLRRPETLVRRMIIAGLHEAGFADILPAHLGVFQHPGPDGQRPSVLALRAQSSKQAMNHLLHQLEQGGYLYREGHPSDRRTRVVRLTDKGRAAAGAIDDTVSKIDSTWAEALGDRAYGELRRGLGMLEAVLDEAGGLTR